jgi:hypothetical protein
VDQHFPLHISAISVASYSADHRRDDNFEFTGVGEDIGGVIVEENEVRRLL